MDEKLEISPLTALSPLDGRYSDTVEPLRWIFSEFGLIRFRLFVEVEWLIALTTHRDVQELGPFPTQINRRLREIPFNLTVEEAQEVKEIERETNHDVKALEYYLKRRLERLSGLDRAKEFVHFGCTSYDINDNCFGLMLSKTRSEVLVPVLLDLIDRLTEFSEEHAETPMLARTHGQPASPTTVGKEFKVFSCRLQDQVGAFDSLPIYGKFNGAVGNFHALLAAYPDTDWSAFAQYFVETILQLKYNPMTTQTDAHDYIAEYCHALQRVNLILLDLCRDVWGYISLGYFKQKITESEVGSSTMPHKVNPIDFENAEGNLGMANACLQHFAEKLPVSRWQRDLSDSTVLRNLGVATGYSLIAYKSVLRGMCKLRVDADQLNHDLDGAWEVLSEAVQTVLRKHGGEMPYEKLKHLTRGARVDQQMMHEFISELNLPEAEKNRLLELTPQTYVGNAAQLARKKLP